MANWTDMGRNLQRHGHFAGTNEAEQDAYFTFISGDQDDAVPGIGLTTQKVVSLIAALSARAVLWVEAANARIQNKVQG